MPTSVKVGIARFLNHESPPICSGGLFLCALRTSYGIDFPKIVRVLSHGEILSYLSQQRMSILLLTTSMTAEVTSQRCPSGRPYLLYDEDVPTITPVVERSECHRLGGTQTQPTPNGVALYPRRALRPHSESCNRLQLLSVGGAALSYG